MLKRILLILANGEIANAMRDYAFNLAQQHQAHLMVLALIDTRALHEGEAVPPGAYALKQMRDEHRSQKALDQAAELIDMLRVVQQTYQISFSSEIIESDEPAKVIVNQAPNYDLVVTMGECLQVVPGRTNKPWLSEYLHNPPRPVLYFSQQYQASLSVHSILFAYDGSPNAARALQQYLFLEIEPSNAHFQVFTHHEDRQKAEQIACEGVGYLAAHGVMADPLVDTSHAKAADIFKSLLETHQPKLVVMGAYGHHSWRERLWGTTTEALMTMSRVPLLIVH